MTLNICVHLSWGVIERETDVMLEVEVGGLESRGPESGDRGWRRREWLPVAGGRA